DDAQIRELLGARLSVAGYGCSSAASGNQGLELLKSAVFDVALIDIHLPDMTGIETLKEIKRYDPDLDAVIMTGFPEVETAVQALRLGAYDYLIKPIEWHTLHHVMKRISEYRYLQSEVTALRMRLAENPPVGKLIGSSKRLMDLQDLIAKVAPTTSAVLI